MSPERMPWNNDAADPLGLSPRTTDAPRRAGIALWITAGVAFIVFGCCAALMGVSGLIPEQDLREAMEDVPQEQVDQFVQSQPALRIGAVVVTLVMVLPALPLMFLGFRVQARSLLAARIARLILLAQTVLLMIMLVMNVAGGVAMGNIGGVLITLIVLGGMLALLIWTVRLVGAAAGELQVSPTDDAEPWNSHLS